MDQEHSGRFQLTDKTRKQQGGGRYREAGVDLDMANELVKRIRPVARTTFPPQWQGDIGGFGGLYPLDRDQWKDPVLVSSTDGVGTKLKVAWWAGRHDTVGIDLVAMCVNDILVQGAEPLFFLDYLSLGKMDLETVEALVGGIAEGCRQAGCALVGGETAEMPGFYGPGEYDMAGFAVGVAERDRIVDGSSIREGDRVLGLASSGLHSNGYSLVRKIVMEELGLKPEDVIEECGRTAAEELLEPTRIYVRSVVEVLKKVPVSGMVHITGGGFDDNLPRVVPPAFQAVLDETAWEIPPIFRFLSREGSVSREEMLHVFNNGVGYVLVVPREAAADAAEILLEGGETVYALGKIARRREGDAPVRWKRS